MITIGTAAAIAPQPGAPDRAREIPSAISHLPSNDRPHNLGDRISAAEAFAPIPLHITTAVNVTNAVEIIINMARAWIEAGYKNGKSSEALDNEETSTCRNERSGMTPLRYFIV